MGKTFSFHPDLHIASLEKKTCWHNLKVHCLLQDPSQKQPSINAYLGARYSRSADSVLDIAREIMQKGTDAAKRLESIFQNYGHKSVGDMADVFVCIENVPMITAMKLFYRNPVLAGQERSTRYQNFEKPAFIKLPHSVSVELKQGYETIIQKQLQDYRELMPITETALRKLFKISSKNKQESSASQARTFDTVRYLLPMGLQTSLGFVMSARNWAELIALLHGSDMSIDRELAKLLYELLVGTDESKKTGYIPEADGLIRHTDANYHQKNSTEAALKILQKKLAALSARKLKATANQTVIVKDADSALNNFARHLAMLNNPLVTQKAPRLTEAQLKKLGQLIFADHNHHCQIGPVGQSGAIVIEGMADFGILKDLNRHRSLERFVPIWHDQVNLTAELDRPNENCFFLCPYLEHRQLAELRADFSARLSDTYSLIKKWRQAAKKELSPELTTEYTKYLLPHAHATSYRFYGSIDDLQYLIHLRTRPGGHIAYRSVTYTWLKKLAGLSPFWQAMLEKIPTVNAFSREQFVDRS
ncbi:MAG: hypothetical protein COY81_04330 [Candidatus Pacebacteria bacterium CG_4_10_14_0_8_um_filter_43_12]|nr:MAG: hypothetical protein COY81_04330 [Candidatus Pacebacteria bacterium CG_4_10_14_0_8_um_filter_43_12]